MEKDLTVKEEQMMKPSRRGFEDPIDQSDLIIPRAKLLQALSPEVAEGDKKAGQLINNITSELLPDKFVPIFVYLEWFRFNARDKGAPGYDSNFDLGALIWRTRDHNDPRTKEAEFGPNGEKPIANRVLQFFSVFENQDMPVVIGFSSTSYKAGKKLLSLCKFTGGDMFSKKYSLTSKHVKNDKGSYYVLEVAPAGLASEEEFKKAEIFWDSFLLLIRRGLRTGLLTIGDFANGGFGMPTQSKVLNLEICLGNLRQPQ